MLNFNSILLFSEDPKELAGFYQKVFGKDPDWSQDDYTGWMVGSAMFTIGPHDQVRGKNLNPERATFNFETEDVAGEFERIEKIGATVIAEPYHPGEEPEMWIATFADPDNNYFQLASPFKM